MHCSLFLQLHCEILEHASPEKVHLRGKGESMNMHPYANRIVTRNRTNMQYVSK